MATKLRLTVTGMTCGGCENAVTRAVGTLQGVATVSASHAKNLVEVAYDETLVTPADVRTRIETLGYHVDTDTRQ